MDIGIIIGIIVLAFYLFLFILVIVAYRRASAEIDLYNKKYDKLMEELGKINKQK